MARALECPACGAKYPAAAISDVSTFRCQRCGQVLKVPASVTTGGPPPPPRRSGAAPGSSAPAWPPPRRAPAHGSEPSGNEPVAVASGGAVSATIAVADDRPAPPRGGPAPAVTGRLEHARVAWYWRLLAWVAAVPLGFLVTAWPAYKLDLIRKDDVLNVFVGSGTGRYARLAIGTAVWALVTALLVQLFVEGGRWWMARRHARAHE